MLPNVCRKTQYLFWSSHQKQIVIFFVGEICRQNAHKNFSGKLGKFGQRSFAPRKIWLFLHLCRRNPFYCALISLRQNLLLLSQLEHFQGTLETYQMFANTLILVFIDPAEKKCSYHTCFDSVFCARTVTRMSATRGFTFAQWTLMCLNTVLNLQYSIYKLWFTLRANEL